MNILCMHSCNVQAMKEALKHSSALVKAARTQARRRALANSALGGADADGEEDREGEFNKPLESIVYTLVNVSLWMFQIRPLSFRSIHDVASTACTLCYAHSLVYSS